MLGVMLSSVGREWYLSDLAAHLNVRPSSLQRTLAKLTRGGILRRRADGNRVYYRADLDCPIFPELSGILTKTAGVADVVRAALAPLAAKIRVAFLHGSIAEHRERSESDIDLIIVGEASSTDIAVALRPARERLGREVNATRYTSDEFDRRVVEGYHFLSAVLKKPKIFLVGGENDLGQIAGRSPGSGRTHE